MTNKSIVALSASLRNGRWGLGVNQLLDQVRSLTDENELFEFVREEAGIHYNQFFEAGRAEVLPFDEIYRNIKKIAGNSGLCNSEIGMVVAIWASLQEGCEINYVPLSMHFGSKGNSNNLEQLKKYLMNANGLLLCTPVYFGDRSSLASDFIEFIRKDQELKDSLKGKPVAGVSVGAKRNGGQETTLIYQLLEMTDFGMLGLGNDSDTTSQYGGTIVAGDVGTGAEDEYGLRTAMGTGRRLGRIVKQLDASAMKTLDGKLRVMFWVLQDSDDVALKKVRDLIQLAGDKIEAFIHSVSGTEIGRCIACDVCPISIGPDEEYRCIIKGKDDVFVNIHQSMLDHDLIVPVVFSPLERKNLYTIYQKFIERTRYIRRGDYLFSDVVVMPLVLNEIGANENFHIRMLTSMIRHHTVVLRSNVGYIYQGNIVNSLDIENDWFNALDVAKKIAVARLSQISSTQNIAYKPVGYVLSVEAESESSIKERKKMIQQGRVSRRMHDANCRIK